MSSSGRSPFSFLRAASGFSSLRRILFVGVGGVLLAGFTNVIELGEQFFNLFILPLGAFASGLARNVGTVVTSFPRIIDQGVITTIASIAPGATFDLGPLTFPLSIVIAGVGGFTMAVVLSQTATSNFALGGLIDIPTPFFDGPEEDVDEEG